MSEGLSDKSAKSEGCALKWCGPISDFSNRGLQRQEVREPSTVNILPIIKGVEKESVQPGGSGSNNVDGVHVANVQSGFRSRTRDIQGQLENARIRLLGPDDMRIEHGVEEGAQALLD